MLAKISLAATQKAATLRSLLLALLAALALAGLLAVAQLNPAIAQSAAPVTYQNFLTTTFRDLGLATTPGQIAGLPPELSSQTGFDTARSWQPGAAFTDILRLGDLGSSFLPQALTLAEIAQASGVDTGNVSLSQFHTLLQRQTLGSLANLAGVQHLALQDVPALHSAFNAAVRPELLTLAEQTGDLPAGAINPEQFVQQALNQFGVTPITDLISSPDHLLGGVNLGEIQFTGPALDQLEAFTVGDIPGLDQIEIADLDGWQELAISDIPGLDQVPFGAFPGLLSGLVNGFGGTHDVTYGDQEHTQTPTKFSITGSDVEGWEVQCAQARGCAHLELAGPGKMHGAQWIAGGTGPGQQMVRGGSGILAAVNGGMEPTGRVPFGAVFKVVLSDTTESEGTGQFSLYTRFCSNSFFAPLGCTPYFIGPIPIWSTTEKGFVLTGPLDGSGGASGGLDVPPELQRYVSQDLGGSYYGSGGSPVQMDEPCLDSLIGALRHSSEAAGAREHIPRIIAAANEAGVTDKAQLAYILGTVSTELEGRWSPISEQGVGCGTYGSGCYYGRGFVQLTWEANYRKMGQVLGIDLVNNPDLANDPDTAAKITVIGMRDGLFTGVGLGTYIGNGKADFRNARRIVNDADKMDYTAQQSQRFYEALQSCSTLETRAGAGGDLNAKIMAGVRAVQAENFSASRIPGTNQGRLGCAGMVNYVLHKAGIQTLGGGPPYGNLAVRGVESAIKGGRGISINANEAQPGDLNVVDMGGGKQHIGVCMNVGCTQVVSNSSSKAARGEASFTWVSDGYFSPSYGGGRRAIYRVTN
ncbi:glycoside hydrolase family 19 protein [Nodosilinea sp. PGN35]|uniref:glycoside hydrolase family 19 protein n=1 Tax=Nodosilinea sp. PGN35 TaxID=3020489 RepID=UPI00398A680F